MTHKLVSAAIVVVLLAACVGNAAPTPTTGPNVVYRVGLVTDVGTVRDGTFNELAHRGAARAAEDFGLDYTYRESVDDSHYAIHIQDLLQDNRNIIITVGFLMGDFTLQAAQENPDVYFIGVDQSYTDPPPNLVGLQFREDEGGFLVGTLAGMMTESNIVGMIAGQPIPPVVRWSNGYINGVHYVNPTADVRHIYAESFTDSEFGRRTARSWVLQGVDVIFGAGGLTGSSAILKASQEGAWVIGVDADEYRTTFSGGTVDGTQRLLTSAMKRVDSGVHRMIETIVNGTFQGGIITLGTAECGIAYAPFHEAENAIPEDVQSRLEAIWRALAGGTLHTGASGSEEDTAPAPLAGMYPPLVEDAPMMEDCNF